jgi:glucokinase
MIEQLASLWPRDGQVKAIGVAAPGPIDTDKGIIYSAPNIPGWENLPLRSILEERFQVPVRLGNDANMAALGEWKYGAGRGHNDLLYFTISTGIGGGVISANRLLVGAWGLAAELGHVTIDPNGPVCGCGCRGHLEAYSSGTAIARYVASELADGVPSSLPTSPAPTTIEIAAAARNGDELALAAFNRAGYYLGLGVANYLHIFNPSIIIFGGGVSRSEGLLFNPMRAALKDQVLSPAYLDRLVISQAALGDDAGLLGALALAREE